MIDGLKPYPAMKDSGVPWLREVPEHWEVMPLRRASTARCDGPFGSGLKSGHYTDHGIRVVRLQNIGHAEFRNSSSAYISADHYSTLGDHDVEEGDLLIAGLGDERHPAGRACVAPASILPAMVKADCFRFRLQRERLHPEFGALQLTATAVDASSLLSTGATRQRTNLQSTAARAIAVPPLPEQAAIVRFLDHADRRIRRYIRAKQKLIKLLEEQKQAIIHRAVTRGLDPNVRLKPSGVEWLGDVPEHWEVVRLKSLVSRVTSGSRGWSTFVADSGVLFIRIGNLTRASLDLDLESSVRLQLPARVLGEAARTRVQRDDILLSITAFIGSVAVVPRDTEEAYVSQHVACCRPREGVANARWVGYVLLSHVGQTHGQLSMYGGTKQGLSLDDVKSYVVLLPPRDEQDHLVKWIEGATASVDAGVRSTKREIALLREYRTRLIADVVTGKLDVREAAVRLPDETDEPEPLDELEAEDDADESGEGDTDDVPEEAEA